MARLFISYATPDRAIADEVASWLRADGHEPFLAHNLRNGISAGEDWKQRLYDELREVDVVISVVTSSFVASPWWVPGVWAAIPSLGWSRSLQRSAGYFSVALRRLARCVIGCAAMGSAGGMLTIVGPSGCGKSSLLNAAVVPLLSRDPAWLTVPSMVPGSDPLPELARALAAAANHQQLGWSASNVRGRLEAGADGLRRMADDLLAADPTTDQPLLLVSIDQAEELFTRTTPVAQQQFAELLRGAVVGPVRVAATLRSEFLDDLCDLPTLAGIPIEAYVLGPLDREMLRDVIEQPAKVARLRLDDGLAAALVADTDSGEALPLLAFTLRQLADGLPAGSTLTLAHYDGLGGVRGALTRHADTALADAARDSGLTEREVLAGLTRLVTVDETGRRARRRIKLTGLAESLRVALRVFVDRRLLLSDTNDDGQVWLTVAHEALLTEWPPLDAATVDIIVALHTARAVERAAAEWNSAGRPEHYLWDAERLTVTLATLGMASDGGSRNPGAPPIVELDDEALAFLDSTAQRVHATQQRERRRRTRTITVLSILLVLALTAAGVAVWQQQRARSAQDTAIARGMVAQADRIRDRDPRGALQFGVAADQFDASPQTHGSLQQTLSSISHSRTLRSHTDAVYGVAFAPDGRTLTTGSDDQTVILWELPRLDRFAGGEVREACLRAGGPLDKATWDQYAPGVSYQDTCADR